MLKNYFKIAIAVLKRRKFFTFISLFGISLTLTILIVLSSFVDLMISPTHPDVNRDRELFITAITAKSKDGNMVRIGPISFYVLNNFISALKTPEKISFFTSINKVNSYQNGKKISSDVRYTDVNYWDIYHFNFVEGKAFSEHQLKNAARVAVISEDTRAGYFGDGKTAVGKYIVVNNEQYRVIGVVQDVPSTSINCDAGIYFPYTLSAANLTEATLFGSFRVVLLAASKSDLPRIAAEYANVVKRIPKLDKTLPMISADPRSYIELRIQEMFWSFGPLKKETPFLILGIFVFLFMLLPTINLVNINISRIMERSSEIGVRKAFGASGRTLVGQFIVENMILTLLGGIIGVVLSFIVIKLLNASGMIPHLDLKINLVVLAWSVLVCLIFGLMSGVYPAWRMSRMNVVKALKANN